MTMDSSKSLKLRKFCQYSNLRVTKSIKQAFTQAYVDIFCANALLFRTYCGKILKVLSDFSVDRPYPRVFG